MLSTLVAAVTDALTSVPERDEDIRRNDLTRQEQAILETDLPSHGESYSGMKPSFNKVDIPPRDRSIHSHLSSTHHLPR
jgi:hypothetical protein